MYNKNKIVLKMAQRVREIATRQGNVPFLTGDLRKSIKVSLAGPGVARIGSNLSYARAVHDGRPQITIRPKNGKFLAWPATASDIKTGETRYISKKTGKAVKRKTKKTIRFIFAKEVTQPARKGKPFLKNAMNEMRRDLSFLEKDLKKEMLDEIRRGVMFKGRKRG